MVHLTEIKDGSEATPHPHLLFSASCLHIPHYRSPLPHPPLFSECDALDKLIADKMERLTGTRDGGTVWKCLVCDRQYKDKTKMKHHIETHLNSFQQCPVCAVACKTRRTLKTHIARAHEKSRDAAAGGGGFLLLDVPLPPKEETIQNNTENPFEPKVVLTSE
jgi:hypothetical protein